ncbi:Uncharacterized protein TCM_017714 [Theobroma cacao]|uniref:Uncharacterized protein n=1 Tax=Theobroma cacao TaxID=3641 RepID=A0A061ELK3_THECC|nr:Uncharacterized protein TCM_017714 [Theobroma cacao]
MAKTSLPSDAHEKKKEKRLAEENPSSRAQKKGEKSGPESMLHCLAAPLKEKEKTSSGPELEGTSVRISPTSQSVVVWELQF